MAGGVAVAELFAEIGADVSGFDKALGKVNSDMGMFGKSMSAIGAGVTTALAVATTAAVGLGVGIGAAVSKAASMEQGIANIAAVMGLAKDETQPLKDLITDLGLDPKLKVTAVEAADAIEMLGKNGLTLDQIMSGAARSTVLLANSTGGTFAGSADIATDVMAQFNISASDMNRAVDQITGVTVASKFSIDDYGLAIAQAGGVASSVGVSFEDFNAAIVATSPSFASGSDAGTSFKTFLQRLVPQSNAAADAMRKLGLFSGLTGSEFDKTQEKIQKIQQKISDLDPTSKGYSKRLGELQREQAQLNSELARGGSAFFDANGNMKDMADIAAALQGAFADLSEADAIEAATSIFGTDAMRTAFSLATGGAAAINEAKAAIGNTSAEESAATRMDTLAGAWEIFEGVIETVTLGIGDKFIPIVREIVDWMTSLAERYGPEIIDFFGLFADRVKSVASFLKTNFALIAAENTTWGERMVVVWDMLSQVAQTIWQTVLTALTNAFPQWQTQLQDWAKAAWQWLVDAIPLALEKLAEWGGALWQWLIDNLPTWISNLNAWSAAAWQWISNAVPLVGAELNKWGNAIWSWLRANGPTWVQTLMDWAEAGWGFIQAIGQVIAAIGDIFQPIIDAIAQWIEWQDVVLGFAIAMGITFAPAIIGAIGAALAPLAGFIAAWTPLLALIAACIAAVAAMRIAWENDWLGIQTGTLYAWGVIKQVFDEVWQRVGEIVARFVEQWAILDATNATLGERLSLIWNTIKEVVSTVWGGIVEVVTTLLPPFIAKMQEYGAAAWEWLAAAVPLAVDQIITWGTELIGWLTENYQGWLTTLASWGTAAWEWLANAIGPMLTKMGEWGGALFKWWIDNLPGWMATLLTWGAQLVAWIGNAISGALRALADYLRDLRKKGDEDGQKTLGDMVADWARIAWRWIVDVAMPEIGPAFVQFLGAIITAGGTILYELGRLAGHFALLLWQWIVDATEPARLALGDWFAVQSIKLGALLTEWAAELAQWGQAIWQWIVDATEPTRTKLQEWYDMVVERMIALRDDITAKFVEVRDNITAKVTEIKDNVIAGVTTFIDNTKAAIDAWKADLVGKYEALRTSIAEKILAIKDNITQRVAEFIDGTKAAIEGWKTDLVAKYEALRSGIAEKIDWIKTNIIQRVGEFIDDTRDAIESWKTALIEKYEMLRGGIEQKITWIKENVIQRVKDFIDDTKERVESWKTDLVAKYEALRHNISEKIVAIKENVIQRVKDFVDDTKSRIETWRTNVMGVYTLLRDNVLAIMAQIKTNVIDPVKSFIDDTKTRISDWKSQLEQWWDQLKGNIKTKWDGIKATVIDPVVTFVDTTKDKIMSWKDWLVAKFTEIWNAIKDKLNPAAWVQWGKDLVDGLRDGITNKWNDFKNWVTNKWNELSDTFKNFFGIHSPSTLFAGFGDDIMQGLANGISSNGFAAQQALAGVAGTLTGQIDGMTGDIQDLVDIINGILGGISMPTIPPLPSPGPMPSPSPMPTPAPTPVPLPPLELGFEDAFAVVGMPMSHIQETIDGFISGLSNFISGTAFGADRTTISEVGQADAAVLNAMRSIMGSGLPMWLEDVTSGHLQMFRNAITNETDIGKLANVVSALTQYREIANLHEVSDFSETSPTDSRIITVLEGVGANLQTLIDQLAASGVGSQFNIDVSGDGQIDAQELAQVIAYLQALYA